MARVTRVDKARRDQGVCRRAGCGHEIKRGESYYWFANRIGRMSVRKVFCSAHYPKASEMTTSDKLSSLYSAQETLDDALANATTIADIVEALNDAASEARDVASEYEDSLSNMPEQLQSGPTGEDIQEKIDSINSWADELESVASDIESDFDGVDEALAADEATDSDSDSAGEESDEDSAEDRLEQARERASEASASLSI